MWYNRVVVMWAGAAPYMQIIPIRVPGRNFGSIANLYYLRRFRVRKIGTFVLHAALLRQWKSLASAKS